MSDEQRNLSALPLAERILRGVLSLLARRSVTALRVLQDHDLANELYDVHESLDRLGAPGAHYLTAGERIEALIARKRWSEKDPAKSAQGGTA